jgi:hypothetical protein
MAGAHDGHAFAGHDMNLEWSLERSDIPQQELALYPMQKSI